MTLEDVRGFDMASTRKIPLHIPHIPLKRLNSDDDIKVWSVVVSTLGYTKASAPEKRQTSLSLPHIGEFYCSLLKPEQPVLSLACTQIMIKLIRLEIERSAAAT